MIETLEHLSEREKEVFELVVDGNTSKDIGKMLGITELTVETHRRNIKKKLQARHLADLFKIAYINQLL